MQFFVVNIFNHLSL